MTTPSSTINDRFLARIRDWRIDSLYNTSGSTAMNEYLETFLMDASDEFSDFCDQDLTYVVSGSATEGYFVQDLSNRNVAMLSKMMVRYWLQKNVNDVLSMALFVTDKDFRTFSSAQNLKAKQDYLCAVKEEISQDLINYSFRIADWDNWNNQIFS